MQISNTRKVKMFYFTIILIALEIQGYSFYEKCRFLSKLAVRVDNTNAENAGNVLKSLQTGSPIDCAVFCAKFEGCVSFSFSDTKCECYNEPEIETWKNNEENSSFFVLKDTHVECPIDWLRNDNSCYLFEFDHQMNWEEAMSQCVCFGGLLAEVETSGEHVFLREIALTLNETSTHVEEHGGFWLGGTDDGHEGIWIWGGSKTQIILDKWQRPPDNAGGSQNCMALKTPNYKWHDQNCISYRNYICELHID